MSHSEIFAIAIGLIAIVFLKYELHGSFTNWILVGCGLLGAGLLKKWVDPNLGWTVGGLSIAGIVTVVIFALFYAEVVKGHGRSRWIAPVVSALFGVSLVLTLGAAGSLILPAGHMPATTSIIQHN